MNVILMTVLLTLLGVGLVVLLVWLSVMSWKSMKHRKQAKLKQQATWNQFDNMSTELEMREDGIRKDFYNSVEEFQQKIEDVYDLIDKQVNDLNNNIGNLDSTIDLRFIQLESSIDSRIDKVYNTIQFNDQKSNCTDKKKK